MSTVTNIKDRRAGITPPPASSGVKLVGARLRCRACSEEWTGLLDAFSEIEPASLRCPRCEANRTPPAAA